MVVHTTRANKLLHLYMEILRWPRIYWSENTGNLCNHLRYIKKKLSKWLCILSLVYMWLVFMLHVGIGPGEICTVFINRAYLGTTPFYFATHLPVDHG